MWATSDLWSTDQSGGTKLLSFTLHFVDEAFKLQKLLLKTMDFPARHTQEAIFNCWVDIMVEFGILTAKEGLMPVDVLGPRDIPIRNIEDYDGWEKINGIIPDNGPNMVAAIRLLPPAVAEGSKSCVAHTAQLAVDDSINAQRAIIDMLAKARGIVGYIKRGGHRQEFLDLQPGHGKTLLQDVASRWNSQLTMVERIAEIRTYVETFCNQHRGAINLSNNQWQLTAPFVELMTPVRVFTKETESNGLTMSKLIFWIQRLLLQINSLPNAGLGTIKDTPSIKIFRTG